MGKISKATVIRSLEQALEEKQKAYEDLLVENAGLRTREDVLLQQVTQQGDNLHFVALAASQVSVAGQDMPDLAKTLMQDLEVHELMQKLGSTHSSRDEPFTTQRLRAAVTPERVEAMRQVTVEQVAAHLKHLTMRMCMLLAAGPDKAHFFNDSIESVVNEYGEYGLLLHVAADWISLEIGTVNLDTLQPQEPPPGYWEAVVDGLELQQDQIQILSVGFSNYQEKSKPIISTLHETVGSIRAILGDDAAAETSGASGLQHISGASSSAACSHGQQQQQQQQQQHGGNCYGAAAAAGATNSHQGSSSSSSRACFTSKPWQQFGFDHGGLTPESAEQLEQYMSDLLQQVMRLRQMHRTVTWLFLNTLNARQHALFITQSWPWWSRPLTMCQYIADKYGTQGIARRSSSTRSAAGGAPPDSAVCTGTAAAAAAGAAAAMTAGVGQMSLIQSPRSQAFNAPAAPAAAPNFGGPLQPLHGMFHGSQMQQ